MRKLLAGIGTLSLLFASAASVGAATVSDIADGSAVSLSSLKTFSVSVTNKNEANISNNVAAGSATGGNVIASDSDQTGTTLKTGDAMSASVIENIANTTEISVESDSGDHDEHSISGVFDSSSAAVVEKDAARLMFGIDNSVQVSNNTIIWSGTGDNVIYAGDDLHDAAATTGNATSVSGVSNLFNMTSVAIKRHLSN